MSISPQASLIGSVAAVGVLHTLVPDHWAPIAMLSRQQGWRNTQTIRAAALAGSGHIISTLALGAFVWLGGAALAVRFGRVVDMAATLALIVFGLWIAVSAWREQRGKFGHAHFHKHADGLEHLRWHEHSRADWHATDGSNALAAPVHEHAHKTSGRTALLLILGSSPMVEGIPAFFAASRYGAAQLVIMATAFGASTIATYIIMCVASAHGLQRFNLGPFERYGEVLSGAVIALLGFFFLFSGS